jgi:hypothetical protein
MSETREEREDRYREKPWEKENELRNDPRKEEDRRREYPWEYEKK